MAESREENFYLAAMLRCPGIGCRYLRQLLEVLGSAEAVWRADRDVLTATKILSPRLSERLANFCRQHVSHFICDYDHVDPQKGSAAG